MAIVRRSNEILKIADYLVQNYVDQGYDVIDETGKVLKKAVPTDPIQLKAEVMRLTAKVAELEGVIADMKKATVEKAEPVAEEKPKRTRKKSEE